MSGDTPTDTTVEAEDEAARAIVATAKHYLVCPDCGSGVFESSEAWWSEDTQEHCGSCGSWLIIGVEHDEDPAGAYVRVSEHAVDIIARLRAEVTGHHQDVAGLQSNAAAVRLQHASRVERLTADDDQRDRDHERALTITRDRVAEAVRLRAEVEGLRGQVAVLEQAGDAAREVAVHHVERARAELERLAEDETERVEAARHGMMLARIDRDDADAREATAIANMSEARAERDGAMGLLRELASLLGCIVDGPGMAQRIVDLRARADQAERERDDTVDALGFGPAIVEPDEGVGGLDDPRALHKGVAAFYGTLTTEESDDEFLDMVCTTDEPGGDQ